MVPIPVRAVGMVWYRQADYPRILQIMADADKLPTTWEKWSERAEQGFRLNTEKGFLVEKVYLDPDEFSGWCKARGLDIDAKARTRFANEAVYAKYRTTH
jgi:hypothetical protein